MATKVENLQTLNHAKPGILKSPSKFNMLPDEMTKRHSREIAFILVLFFAMILAFYPVLFSAFNRVQSSSAIELQLSH